MKKLLTLAICVVSLSAFGQIDCKKNISVFKDRFTDEVQVRTAKPSFGSNLFAGKRFDKSHSIIAEEMYFKATGYDPASRDGKIYIILDNNEKLELDAIVDTDILRSTRLYSKSFQYIARVNMTPDLWDKFSKNRITDFRINGFEEKVGESAGKILKERINCLITFNPFTKS